MMENTEKKTKLRKRKKSKTEIIFICAMLAWPLVHFSVFWLYVNANTFYLTFFRFDTTHGGYYWIGLERFRDILKSIFVTPRCADHKLCEEFFNGISGTKFYNASVIATFRLFYVEKSALVGSVPIDLLFAVYYIYRCSGVGL